LSNIPRPLHENITGVRDATASPGRNAAALQLLTLQLHKHIACRQGSPAEKLYPRYLREYSARHIDILWNFTLRYLLQ